MCNTQYCNDKRFFSRYRFSNWSNQSNLIHIILNCIATWTGYNYNLTLNLDDPLLDLSASHKSDPNPANCYYIALLGFHRLHRCQHKYNI